MKFTINGKEYEGAKYDFNTHCEFDALGVNVLNIQSNPLPVLRAYLSICSGMDLIACGKELEAHLIKGGSLAEVMALLTKEITSSDFFIAITKRENQKEAQEEEKETPEEEKEKTKPAKNTKANEENTAV